MSEFEERLQKAIHRGKRRGDATAAQERAQRLSEDELKRLHSNYRLQISDHVESCIKKLADHFPGFQTETIFGERGWGAACFRDDLSTSELRNKRSNVYSRLEVTVRPYSQYSVIDLAAKGTIHNKEIFKRSLFEELAEVDVDQFIQLIDTWCLEYAELYAATT